MLAIFVAIYVAGTLSRGHAKARPAQATGYFELHSPFNFWPYGGQAIPAFGFSSLPSPGVGWERTRLCCFDLS